MGETALGDLRVLDLTRLLPGGLCTLLLADLGAEVIKIEAPPMGDYARNRGPHIATDEATTSSASFRALNRNKKSVVLDLKKPKDREALLELSQTADVLVESFRPGVTDRLGVGYAALTERNPRLIYCSLSGWGPTGALSQRAGHDINYLAATGLLSFTGSLEEEPVVPPMQVADSASGLHAAVAILAAVHERGYSGRGQHIELSLAHSALTFGAMTIAGVLATGKAHQRTEGVWSGGAICYQVYRCADGWVALGALEEKFWHMFCRALGRQDLLDHRYDPPGSPAHHALIEIFAQRTRAQWQGFADGCDCCLNVVSGLLEALSSEMMDEPKTVYELTQQPGEPTYRALGLPYSLSRTTVEPTRLPAPGLGAHTAEVLGSLPSRGAPTGG